MRRITSVRNAIKYFEENTTVEIRKNSKGDEYKVHIPPAGFHRMNVTEPCYDTKGRVCGYVTQHIGSFQWGDYAKYLREKMENICKLVVYYD